MPQIVILMTIIYYSVNFNLIQCYMCSNFTKNIRYDFYPIKHCQRSNKTIVGVYNFDTVNECAAAARNHFALAFNFAPKARGSKNLFEINNNLTIGMLRLRMSL